MFEQLGYDLRVAWACAVKDIRTALRSPASNLIIILVPINFLILELLFALAGGLAPTAVVNNDPGPYAQQFVQTMQSVHSFRVIQTTADEAQRQIGAGDIIAIVTIPASFDDDLTAGRQINIPVTLNNLNVDFTNDIRRAIPLTITSFYAKAFPGQVVVQVNERDLHAQDTDYIPYLAVSVLVIAIMLGGMLQAGNNMAVEYERETIKELLLSPASRWAIQVGKVLGALMVTALSTAVVIFVVVVILQVPPLNWLEVIAYALVMMPIFGAIGGLLGTVLRSRRAVIPLSLVLVLPLFFLSGAFGPTSFGGGATDVIAKLTPSYYGIAAFQHAFHGFTTTPTSAITNLLILVGFAALAVVVSALMLRRTSLAH